MKHDLIKKIEELDSNFEQNFNKYVSETETRSQTYTKKLEENQQSSKEINALMRAINRCKEHIDLMKVKIQQNKN